MRRAATAREDDEQAAVIEWACWVRVPDGAAAGERVADYLLHVPNGGSRRRVEAARFKRLGVRAGVPDLLLALPRSGAAGLWLEMKREARAYAGEAARARALTCAQRDWLRRLEAVGYATVVAYGAAAAIEAIREYLGLSG